MSGRLDVASIELENYTISHSFPFHFNTIFRVLFHLLNNADLVCFCKGVSFYHMGMVSQ